MAVLAVGSVAESHMSWRIHVLERQRNTQTPPGLDGPLELQSSHFSGEMVRHGGKHASRQHCRPKHLRYAGYDGFIWEVPLQNSKIVANDRFALPSRVIGSEPLPTWLHRAALCRAGRTGQLLDKTPCVGGRRYALTRQPSSQTGDGCGLALAFKPTPPRLGRHQRQATIDHLHGLDFDQIRQRRA